ncbi:MAG: hypothetical protein ABJH68_17525 [Ilumatobacter sp.]|uniref:hypothetical protein n=1 Tax=Ilumatobacter sp. TaxID=1967498 RepID=UPI0032978F41
MALLPRAFRPAYVIRQTALRKGVFGPSLFWKVIAGWVFGKSTIKKFFGKQPENLGTWKVGSNGFVNVINAKPPTKKQRKASGMTTKAARSAIIAAAVADARRKNPDAKIVVKSK